MQSGDHRLWKVGAARPGGQSQAVQTATDAAAVPPAAVLLVERYQRTVVVDPGVTRNFTEA